MDSCPILVEVPWFDAGGEQCITLQIKRLAAVSLDTHIADQHGCSANEGLADTLQERTGAEATR